MSDKSIVVCPYCLSKNRVAPERREQDPVCGQCKKALFDGQVFSVDKAAFDRLNQGGFPLVVDFWASWCGPCLSIAPLYTQLASDNRYRARFVKVNTEEQTDLAGQFAIRSIPTFMVFENGVKSSQQAGALPKEPFAMWLDQVL
ncbi:thioredoxin TrxC [Alginatibacterium sediminis]|uniref:Thioredoxin TrxC n=1 Tax=Alginatibacterium sediminis TaxID=2164068 RepID=A0A420E985_9ALTE|nr:thioredoxin TrxC [Alginatibacterium sediminis]RKF15652.1 thioredoxin TrxC [Alginatibacterium sediminis]